MEKQENFCKRQAQKLCRLFPVAILLFLFLSVPLKGYSNEAFSSEGMQQNTVKVTGTVKDTNGEPIIGANVMVVGSATGVITDIDGNFTLNVPVGSKLQFSFIGYKEQVVPVKKGISLNIVLEEDAQMLGEVEVVAYGVQKKVSVTGAISSMRGDDLLKTPAGSISNILSGQVTGISSVQYSGEPGADAADIYVRGIATTNNATPLIQVDGVERDFSQIDPNEIESVTILKDASATAVFGVRGANGVILITTKSAKTEKAKVTFDAKWGSNSRMVPQYDVIGTAEYYETQYKTLYNSKIYTGSSKAEAYNYADKTLLDAKNGGFGYLVYTVPDGEKLIGNNFKLNPNAKLGYSDGKYYYTPDDWYDEVFSSNFRQEYNVNISGRSDKLNYYASVGYLNDSGIIQNSAYKRYTGRAKVDYQAKEWLKVGTNIAYTYSDSQAPDYQDGDSWGSSANLFYVSNTIAPIYPLYVRNADGSIAINPNTGYKIYDSGNNSGFSRPSVTGNAARDIELNRQHEYTDLLSGKWYANITPIEGLTLTANISANVQNSRLNQLSSAFGSASADDGSVFVQHTRMMGVNNQYLATYARTFADKHNADLLVGYEQYRYKNQVLYGENTNCLLYTSDAADE